jgi:NADH:ubiquinone oxidoreductase subunit F (NADH-binding)/NADH:ubiquinone oxidoreductase subunit E
MLIDQLRLIQQEHGYLPAAALRALSERARIPLYDVHGVASFYPHFRLTPPPAVDVRVCADMSCHLRGADELSRSLAAHLADRGLSGVGVRPVSCLGQCDRAPAGSINDVIVPGLTPARLADLVGAAAAGAPLPHMQSTPASTPLGIHPYAAGAARYAVLAGLLASRDVDGVLTALKASELRGLGGAGFPTGVKWEIVRAAAGPEKYVVCNADESEPGTIKDRFLMEHAPHLVLEGMIVAGVVTGARTGIIYIRHEYEAQAALLQREIDDCRGRGLIGDGARGGRVPFEVSIFVSPGGYICGEESALLEALEGKRAEPRNKPPFPGTHGLWQKPTLINNVETFALVPLILTTGAEAFKRLGRGGVAGPKFVGVSGHVERPGVYEIAMGTPAREVIFERAGGVLDGRALKAFAPSGASSGYLPASMVDVPLDFKSLQQAGSMLGSGAIVVCADGTCMLDMALNAVRFFRNESCGKCVPCRVGSAKLVDILTEIAHGRGHAEHLETIDQLSEAMALTSICGLGQVAPAPITSVITHFPEEIEAHVARQRCPSGVCPMA